MFEYFICGFSNLINVIHTTHLENMITHNFICKTMDIVYTIIVRLISMLGLTPSMELKVLKPSLYYHKPYAIIQVYACSPS